jgi:molecular chaperone DnaK
MITRLLAEKLGINPKRELPQDEAVVLGAAVQAGIKSGVVSPDQGIILQDICPHALGVAVAQWTGHQYVFDVFDEMIKKGTVIPCDEVKEYSTVADDQKQVLIRIFAGNNKHVSQNTQVGEFTVEGIPPSSAGEEKIKIHFSYDINGNLKVRAKILSTGAEGGEDFLLRPGQLTQKELEAGKENIEHLWEKHPEISEVKAMIKKAEERMAVVNEVQKEQLKKMIGEIKRALLNGNLDLVKEINDKLTDFLFELE